MTPGTGNFANDLHAAAAERLEAPFLIEPGADPITYGAFFARVSALAGALAELGAGPGDRVIVQVDKSVDAVALYVACLHAGTVHVPLNPAFTDDEVAYFIDDANPAVVVRDLDVVREAARHADPITEPVPRADDDLAALLYTSGTTGRPKGAALTHTSLRFNARALHQAWAFTPHDHLIHGLPIFHVHGLFVALHCAMLSAIPVTFLPRFDADAVITALPDATVFMGVPTHYGRLLDHPGLSAESTAAMRLFTAGSAPLTETAFAAFTDRTGHRICERYGMSETGITTSNPYDGERRAGTVGFAVANVELRVCDADGHTVAAGDTGIVEVRGPQLMKEYWGRPDATAEATRPGGWFITGDVGSLDTHGRLTLQGRAGDMIISGGENVYPKEIELVLDAIDGIDESAVIGVGHPDFGEAVVAAVVVADDPGDAAIQDALDRSLARFKHPKQIHRIDALPRNTMGKVQKNVLRERYASSFT